MQTLTAMLTGLLTLVLLTAPGTAVALDTNIPALADRISALSPGEIQTALHQPIPDDSLPASFSDATPIDQADATMQATDTGAAKAVSQSMIYTPGGEATPASKTAHPATGPARVYNTASVTYLIFDETLSQETLADVIRASIGDQAANAKVEDITINGQGAFHVTLETTTNGIPIVMEWVAVPVGKVVVIGMTMSGGDSVNRDELFADAQALSQSAIAYLQTSVDQRGTPAG